MEFIYVGLVNKLISICRLFYQMNRGKSWMVSSFTKCRPLIFWFFKCDFTRNTRYFSRIRSFHLQCFPFYGFVWFYWQWRKACSRWHPKPITKTNGNQDGTFTGPLRFRHFSWTPSIMCDTILISFICFIEWISISSFQQALYFTYHSNAKLKNTAIFFHSYWSC